ncbi:MAG: ribosome small subunit-dependent GTPase A [Acidimicrobiales bacterium]
MESGSLAPYGWNERWVALFRSCAPPGTTAGRVLRHDSSALMVAQEHGVGHVAMGRGLEPVTVGDWVAIGGGQESAETVMAVVARSSLLRRLDSEGKGQQLLAANVDVVVVVAGLDRPLKHGRVQRAITLAWDSGAVPAVVLSKADMAVDAEDVRDSLATASPGVDVLLTSAHGGQGLDDLHALTKDRTVVVLGESGAGKSTLINVLCGADVAATGQVRSGDSKGRHTTTFRQLHLLPTGGCVIDTPGLRAVGLVGTPEAVGQTFSEIDEFACRCRFRDCAHQEEPGCAVQEAVLTGDLPAGRFEAWKAMDREARSALLRADERARRMEARRFGRMTREAQRHKRP